MSTKNYWSRIEKFHNLSVAGRKEALCKLPLGIEIKDLEPLNQALPLDVADCLSENVIGSFSLPFGVAPNFLIDGKPCLVPMVCEEPSVVAAASKMAKIVGLAGGFFTHIDQALITGQVQIYNFSDVELTLTLLEDHKEALISYLNDLCPNMVKRGGGVQALGFRVLKSPLIGPMIIIEPVINVVDAMGANIVNTLMENLAHKIASLVKCDVGLRILSNLCDQRLARASCAIPYRALATDEAFDNGRNIAQKMLAAQAFAQSDIYRACTHNKGILNGIDAVAIATGNDFRAIEAGAHAYASQSGSYQPLTSMSLDDDAGVLRASLTLPLAVGVVGGSCGVHQGVKIAKKILGEHAACGRNLSSVMVSVGLAQCLGAVYALCSQGIQQGHMKLHERRAKLFEGKPT